MNILYEYRIPLIELVFVIIGTGVFYRIRQFARQETVFDRCVIELDAKCFLSILLAVQKISILEAIFS